MLYWMTHKLESRLLARNINDHRHADETTSMAESKEELKRNVLFPYILASKEYYKLKTKQSILLFS